MDYMQRALALARQALGTTSPNPPVGAVIVKDGKIVGEGYTQPPGFGHAEIIALRQAGEASLGATMYVTLEPCAHFGRTPPCTRAIVAAGIAEVHMAMIDPNPLVFGKGRSELEAAGVKTHVGENEEEAKEVNEAYIKFITTGLPFVIVKFAMSLDGKIATRLGDSKWITKEESRAFAHKLRATSDAIMVGVNTVLTDSPRLTARVVLEGDKRLERQPLRVIVDSHGRMPTNATLLREPGKALVATTNAIPGDREKRLEEATAQIVKLPDKKGMVDLQALMMELGRRDITSLLVEGGSDLLGSLFDERLVDKVYAFIAPIIIGGTDAVTPVGGRGVLTVAEALRLKKVQLGQFAEGDVLISGYVDKGGES